MNDNTVKLENIPQLILKDNDGRLNTFRNATVEVVYIFGVKFYKISHIQGEIYYNPANIIFLQQ